MRTVSFVLVLMLTWLCVAIGAGCLVSLCGVTTSAAAAIGFVAAIALYWAGSVLAYPDEV